VGRDVQRAGDLAHDLERRPRRDRAALQHLREVHPVDELHHDGPPVVEPDQPVDLDHRAVADPPQQPSLVPQPLRHRRDPLDVGVQHLERDRAHERALAEQVRPVHGAEPAAAEDAVDPVPAPLPGHAVIR
jgi:hypothetical protein